MTVSKTDELYNNRNGDGSTTQFDFDFLIEDESQLIVMHTDKAGVQSVLELNKDYTIAEVGNNNGSHITFPIEGSLYNIATEDEIISLILDLPYEQDTPYNESELLIKKRLERNFDYITKLLKIQNRKLERAVKVPEGSTKLPDKLFLELDTNVVKTREYAQVATEQVEKSTGLLNDVNSKVDYINGKIEEINSRIIIGDPIPTLSDVLPDNAIWLEGAKVAKVDYPTLHNVYGDKYYITNFEDVGLISSGVQFEYSGKLTNYSSRNFIQTAEKFITNGRAWSIRFRHKTPSAFSAVYSLCGNATGANYKQAIELDVMTTGFLRLCLSSNGTSYNIVNAKTGTNKLLVDTWYDIILKFTGSAYILTFKQVTEDEDASNEGEWTTDLNIASELTIYQNDEEDNVLALGNHVYTASAQQPCLGTINFTKSHILTTSENATENFDTVFWSWTKKRDEDVDYFKLPDARNRVLWGTTNSNFGYLSAQLPNITGILADTHAINSAYIFSGASGAFAVAGNRSGYAVDSAHASSWGFSHVYFNASHSNSIYKDGSTNIPPALKFRVYTYYA